MKGFYDVRNFKQKNKQHLQSTAIKILTDYILIQQHSNLLHQLFNGANPHPHNSFLEDEYFGLFTLFELGKITNESHQKALSKLTLKSIDHSKTPHWNAKKIWSLWEKKLKTYSKNN